MRDGRSQERRRRRRLGGAAALLLLGAVVTLVYLFQRRSGVVVATSHDARAGREKPNREISVPASSPSTVASAAEVGERAEEVPAERVAPGRPPPLELPPGTQLLTAEFHPGTTDWEEVLLLEGSDLQLRILPLRYNVIAPAPIVILVEVSDRQGRRQPLGEARVRLRPLEAAEEAAWIDVPVEDRGDGQYVASYAPSTGERKRLYGRVLAEASVRMPGTGVRRIAATLIYTAGPRARLIGTWRDWKEGGHLWIAASLDVEEAGVFTLMAQIFGPHLEPIAWVRETQTLGAGRQTLALQVWGKALHDRGVDGPYRVRQVLLSRDDPERGDYDPGPTIEEAHQTAAYRAGEFSAEPYVGPVRPPATVDIGRAAPVGERVLAPTATPPAAHGERRRPIGTSR